MQMSKPYSLMGEAVASIHQHIVGGQKHVPAVHVKPPEDHHHQPATLIDRVAVSDDLPSAKLTAPNASKDQNPKD